jgi:hypothetical protein
MTLFAPPFRVDIELKPEFWPEGYKYGLDAPTAGSIAESFSVELRGFIFRPSNLRQISKPKFIEFKVNGSSVWSCPISLPRPDLLQSEKFTGLVQEDDIFCGFNTVIPSFLSPADTSIELEVTLDPQGRKDSSFLFAIIRFTPIDRAVETFRDISLLNIISIGRSGSSLLCKILDHHQAFFVPKLFEQYGEVSILNHYLRAIAVLCSEGAYSQLNVFEPYADFLTVPTGYFHLDDGKISDTSLNANLMAITRNAMLPLFKSVVREISRYARKSKPNCSFWVEKTWNYMSSNLGLGLLENMKMILLVRDIRSFWKSQYAFQKKLLVSQQDITNHVNGTFDKYVNIVQRYEAMKEHICLVKYEDLIEIPTATLARIFRFLGIELEQQFTESVSLIFRGNDDHARYMRTETQDMPAELELEHQFAALSVDKRNFINNKLSVFGYSI